MNTRFQQFLVVAAFGMQIGLANAQAYEPELRLEEYGTITSVNSAGNTVTISGRTMKLSPTVEITTAMRGLRLNGLSLDWVGAKVGYQWYEHKGKDKFVTHLHFMEMKLRDGVKR